LASNGLTLYFKGPHFALQEDSSMLPERLRNLPYLVHTNRELGLMLRGVKPLAFFLEIRGREPECLIRYWRMFDRHLTAGRLIKREFIEPAPQLPHLESRTVFYAIPGEEWRVDAMRELLRQSGEWSPERERRFGELLGYEHWQNDFWLAQEPPQAKK
jgi:hypothetical protein